jgi:alanine dehydrogenase
MLKVGLLKELNASEGRVFLTPEGVKVLTKNGIEVFVEHNAGATCRFSNLQYEQAGAVILPSLEKVFNAADILLRVLTPKPVEFEILKPSHIFLSFLNLIHNKERVQALLETKSAFISAELIQNEEGKYPILMTMSEIAGQMAIYESARLLTREAGGKGKLLSATSNSKPATITIVGAGMVGRTAAAHAFKNGAKVNLLSLKEAKPVDPNLIAADIAILRYDEKTIKELLPQTDILIVAVHSLTKSYDIKITREMVGLMEAGSVLLDISAEQTNAVETSHLTNHEQPTYVVDGVIHYCVPNITATVPVTASRILTKKILPYVKSLATGGIKDAIVEEPGLISANVIYKGKMTNRFLADQFERQFYNIFELLELNL